MVSILYFQLKLISSTIFISDLWERAIAFSVPYSLSSNHSHWSNCFLFLLGIIGEAGKTPEVPYCGS